MGWNTISRAKRANPGIGHCLLRQPGSQAPWDPRQTLDATLAATASGNGVSDVVVEGYDR